MSFTVPALTDAQQGVIEFWKSYNVPGQWFISEKQDPGTVEALVIVADTDTLTMWSIVIEPDGEYSASEYMTDEDGVGEWSTGITI